MKMRVRAAHNPTTSNIISARIPPLMLALPPLSLEIAAKQKFMITEIHAV